MGKFKKSLVTAVKEEQKQAAEQEKLHKKHKVKDPGILVIEKDNMVKFFIRNVTRMLRLSATILLFILAALGLMALLYPDIRAELLNVLMQIFNEMKKMR